MSKFTDFFKHHAHPTAPEVPSQLTTHSSTEIRLTEGNFFRYRKQRGVNLGSWFVLERWIAESPYCAAAPPGQSDLDVARGTKAKEILEHHWNTWITEQDWAWIVARGINTVRIPIGYYHICGADPSVLHGTDFADFEHVYSGAWSRITNALATAYRHGLGVLIDLHAAPGKQNADPHAGTSEAPAFFTKKNNMEHTTRVLCTLVQNLQTFANSHDPPLPNLVGLELLNEPRPESHGSALQKWYLDTFRALRSIDPHIPLYIGDVWQTDNYALFLGGAGVHFAVLDHHLYRCFTQEDTSTPAAQHTRALSEPHQWAPQMFARAAQKLDEAGCGLVVGEWSGGLNPGSLQGVDEDAARREYVAAQLALYERYCAGWFFWTYKKELPGDKGWSLRDAAEAGVFPSWVGFRPRKPLANDSGRGGRRDVARAAAVGQHAAYWSQYPGHYEHWRLEEGFDAGWEDAYMFLTGPTNDSGAVSELGFKGAWAKRRVQYHAAAKGNSNLWEYEHGFSQGAASAAQDCQQIYC